MKEVLLGHTFLNKIGFKFSDHLQSIHEHIHNKNVEEINTDKVKFAATKYQELSYTDQDDDPIGLPEGISAGIGKDSKESYRPTIHSKHTRNH